MLRNQTCTCWNLFENSDWNLGITLSFELSIAWVSIHWNLFGLFLTNCLHKLSDVYSSLFMNSTDSLNIEMGAEMDYEILNSVYTILLFDHILWVNILKVWNFFIETPEGIFCTLVCLVRYDHGWSCFKCFLQFKAKASYTWAARHWLWPCTFVSTYVDAGD